MISFLKKNSWFSLGLFALIIRWCANFSPNMVESIYSNGIFLGIRWLFDHTITLIPVPLYYCLIVAAIYFVIRYFIKRKKYNWKTNLRAFPLHLLNLLGGIIFSFLFLWGYNYARIPIEDKLSLEVQPLGLEKIVDFTAKATQNAKQARTQIPNVSDSAIDFSFLPKDLKTIIRADLEKMLTELGYSTIGHVQINTLRPKGVLLRISTAGFYLPFMGEGNIDAGLHPLQYPFVIAHEMAHGYGFGDEGTCNFLAYLACINSEFPIIRYSGYLAYWRYIASEYLYRDPFEYEYFRSGSISKGMFNDMEAIYENGKLYQDLLPAIRDGIYDNYLRLQGIEDGLANYNRVVLLVSAFEEMD